MDMRHSMVRIPYTEVRSSRRCAVLYYSLCLLAFKLRPTGTHALSSGNPGFVVVPEGVAPDVVACVEPMLYLFPNVLLRSTL